MNQLVTQDERLIARLLFVNRLLKANSQAFQQVFWSVMRAKHKQEFVEVRPQGRFGDGGNDGYLPAEGHYFQVYGPIDPIEKVTEAADKLGEDFGKLRTSWSHHTPIHRYSFVFNDKYEGTFVRIAQALSDIEKTYPTVKCRPFTAANLEDAFMDLPTDGVQSVLGTLLPDPARVTRVDYSALREVITHVMNSPSNATSTRFGELPDLDEKIRLNNLCSAWADMIRRGARQAGHVDTYFSKNSTFMKQAVRDRLVELYRQARDAGRALTTLPSEISREDIVFTEFRQRALPPNATVAAEAAVEIIIGYYFEACDIFDPHAAKGSTNASP